MKRHAVVALVVAMTNYAHAEPLNFADTPPGFATSAFRRTTPTTLFSERPEASSRRTALPAAQQGQATEQLRRKAEELYKATSRDAETFEAALLIPEIRLKLERALHQKLSNQMLHHLADHSKSEATFWYRYMQGLEKPQ